MPGREIFTWKIGGTGGQGQQAAGAIFAQACCRGGHSAMTYAEYPSIIRGGHGTTQVSVGRKPVLAPYQAVNLLVALNEETVQLHAAELTADGAIMYDPDTCSLEKKKSGRQMLLPLPLGQLLKQAGLPPMVKNITAVAASLGLVRFNLAVLQAVIRAAFAGKGEFTVAANGKAADLGYAYAIKHFPPHRFAYAWKASLPETPVPLLTGNEGLSLGLVAAGCQLYVAYPMSPSSSILHTLAAWAVQTGMVVRQPEDEIAGIHLALGANFTGARAAVGTSGGGFALMNEAVTLAAMTETPAVLVVCSRPGPATGLPTWTEQGDLKYLINCGHGDFPRVVLTPGDPQEAYDAAGLAFNLAETYQVPVFILMDKFLCESAFSLPNFVASIPALERGKILDAAALRGVAAYQRYAYAPDGVSPRARPGTLGGIHLANSDEHDEAGFAIESFGSGELTRRRMMEKRAAKTRGVASALPQPVRYGPATADLTLVGWGSTKGPALEALHHLPYVNYVHLPAVWPFPEHALSQHLAAAVQLVTVENNFSGQFATVLRGQTGITPHHQLLKYNGQQFWPEELVEKVQALLYND